MNPPQKPPMYIAAAKFPMVDQDHATGTVFTMNYTHSVARQPYYSHLCDLCQFRGAFTDRKGVIHDIYHCLATDGRHCQHPAVVVTGSHVTPYSAAYLESCKRRGQPDMQYHIARIYLDAVGYLDANLDPLKRTPGRPGKYSTRNLSDKIPAWRKRLPLSLTSHTSAPMYPEMQAELKTLQMSDIPLTTEQELMRYSYRRFLHEAQKERNRDHRKTAPQKPITPAQQRKLDERTAKQEHREQMREANRLLRLSIAQDQREYAREAREARDAAYRMIGRAPNPLPEQADHVAREALRKVQQARRRKNE